MPKVTSIRISDELATRLDQLAASVDRPRSWLIEQAIARYVDEEAWQVAAITEALADYRSGKAVVRTHDEVMRRLEAHIRGQTGDASPLA
ncbi:MAG TPA: CopG family ribbon-helix-helix protein [Chloroflexota bacterium]|jgi:predicted transcriptional regulator